LNTYQSPAGKMTKVIQGLPQQQQSGGDIDSQINALMSQVTAMMKPGYREKHPDAAYSSREYRGGVPDIQNRPEYQNLVQLLQLKKTQAGAMGTPVKTPEMIGQEEAAKQMAKDDALGRRASIPGTPEYTRVQKEKAQKESVLAAQENTKVAINSKLDNLLGPVGEGGQRSGGSFDDAMGKIGFFSTGLAGQVLGLAGGTDAYDLEQALEPIRSNLTVETINEMKKQSPTGATGLGQIAIKELEMLQGAVRSLKKEQSQDQLRNNMAQVRTHLQNWEKTVQQAKSQGIKSQSDLESQAEGGGGAPSGDVGGKVMTMQDVMDTARSRGKTIDQVLKDARAAGFTIK
jgi:hypothetical protein